MTASAQSRPVPTSPDQRDATGDLMRQYTYQAREQALLEFEGRSDAERWQEVARITDEVLKIMWGDIASSPLDAAVQTERFNLWRQHVESAAIAVSSQHAPGNPGRLRMTLTSFAKQSRSWDIATASSIAAFWRLAAVWWLAIRHAAGNGVPAETVIDAFFGEHDLPENRSEETQSNAEFSLGAHTANWNGTVLDWQATLSCPRVDAVAEEPGQVAVREIPPPAAMVTKPPAPVVTTPPTPATQPDTRERAPAPMPAIDGRRMQASIVPTWLGLVGLSWVGLIWGGIVTAPFTLGGGMLAAATVGLFVVPVWATVFGFAGMNAASQSTLTELEFTPLDNDDEITQSVHAMAKRLDLPPPKVGMVPLFNAFAVGNRRDAATVALGSPLLERLTPEERDAVVGHELGHIVSGDMRRMMLMRTFQNACVWFMVTQGMKMYARWVFNWVAELYILGASRKREYWADAVGAALAGKEAMIGVLRKLEDGPALTDAERLHARFMVRGRTSEWFRTHPETASRIRALECETYLRLLPRKLD